MNRREFIKGAMALAIAVAIPAGLVEESKAMGISDSISLEDLKRAKRMLGGWSFEGPMRLYVHPEVYKRFEESGLSMENIVCLDSPRTW